MYLLNLCEKFLFDKNFIFSTISEIIFIGLSLFFFQKILKLKFSKKNQGLYVLLNTLCFALISPFVLYECSYFAVLTTSILLMIFLLKVPVFKTLAYFSIKSMFMLNIQYLIFNIITHTTNLTSYSKIMELPISIIASTVVLSGIAITIYHLSKNFKGDSLFHKSMKEKANLITVLSILNLGISLLIAEQFSQNIFYLLWIDLYFYISCSTIANICYTSYLKENIHHLKLYIKTVLDLNDENRNFNNDIHNILQAIGGYISTNNMAELKKFYKRITKERVTSNNLLSLSEKLIDNPPIYNILVDKYRTANDHNIHIDFDITSDFNHLSIENYELSRILGILLDNAIEASKECEEKNINISFKENEFKKLLTVKNTYNNKEISIDQIFEKDFTTKPDNTGLGLWEVKQILDKNSNLNLHTTKNDDYFSQQLEIHTS